MSWWGQKWQKQTDKQKFNDKNGKDRKTIKIKKEREKRNIETNKERKTNKKRERKKERKKERTIKCMLDYNVVGLTAHF